MTVLIIFGLNLILQTTDCQNPSGAFGNIVDVINNEKVSKSLGITYGHFGKDVLNWGLEENYQFSLRRAPFGVGDSKTGLINVPESRIDKLSTAVRTQLEELKGVPLGALTIATNGHGSDKGSASLNDASGTNSHLKMVNAIFDEIDNAGVAKSVVLNIIYDACEGASILPVIQARVMDGERPKYLVNFMTSSDADKPAYGELYRSQFEVALSSYQNFKSADKSARTKGALNNPLSYLRGRFLLVVLLQNRLCQRSGRTESN